jgi:hypothetical protein
MYSAGTGYDLATGLGTPRLTDTNGSPGLAEQLCDDVTTGASTAPSVSGLTPSLGPIAGGGTVTIAGSNFGATQGAVLFGNTPAAVTSWSSSSITVTAPAYLAPAGSAGTTAGSADVTVVTASPSFKSSSPGVDSVFHFVGGTGASPVPVVDYIGPTAGPATGGTLASATGSVTVVGAGFQEAGGVTGVTFGGLAASSVHVIDDNELTVVPPAQTGSTTCATDTAGICQVQVIVSNANGPSAAGPILPALSGPIVFSGSFAVVVPPDCGCEVVPGPTEYDYAPLPTITSESPSFADAQGGTTVAITGTGFNLLDFQWVNVGPPTLGTSQDFSLVAITPTEVDVVFPGDPNGTPGNPDGAGTAADPVAVSVQTGGGLASVTYAFAGVPKVTALSKHVGAVDDPGSLRITGKGFDDADLVVFASPLFGIASTTTHFVVHSDTSMTVQVPEFFDVMTDTLVCSETGCSPITPADAFLFTYPGRPVVNSVSPRSGPAHGGNIVTINGALDSNVTAIHFGRVPVTTLLSEPFAGPSGPITVIAPAGVAGSKVEVTVTTAGGILVGHPTSATSARTTYTYKRSTPSAPRDLIATAGPGKGSIIATWKAPASNGGSAITGYIVRAEPQGKGVKPVSVVLSKSARKTTFLKLSSKVEWVIEVIAKSPQGHGLPAISAPVKVT